jgi:hypothetical protein
MDLQKVQGSFGEIEIDFVLREHQHDHESIWRFVQRKTLIYDKES